MRALAPPGSPEPFGRYAHVIAVPAGARGVATSGQLPLGPGGAVPGGAEAQAAPCLRLVAAILAEGGWGSATSCGSRPSSRRGRTWRPTVTERAHMAPYMRTRDAWLDGLDHRPASTPVIVSGFTRPEFLVEVEALAARVD